jgi:hypothetical protein
MRIMLLSLVFAVGCHDAARDVQKLADRACACGKTDKACAEKVIDDFVDFAKANKNAKGDEEAAAKAFGEMMKCATERGADMTAIMAKMKDVAE